MIAKIQSRIFDRNGWLIVPVIFMLAWYALPGIMLASDNLRMVDAFDTDEGDFLWLIIDAYQKFSLEIPLYCYGHLYYNTGLFPLLLSKPFGEVSGQFMAMMMRTLSLAYYGGSVYLMYLMATKWFGARTAALTVLLMTVSSTVALALAINLHPDTAQLFFVVLCLYTMMRFMDENRIRYFVLSAISAGLAFSSKYSGILLLLPLSGVIWLYSKPPVFFNSRRNRLILELVGAGIAVAILQTFLTLHGRENFTEQREMMKDAATVMMSLVVGSFAAILAVDLLNKNSTSMLRISWKYTLSVWSGCLFFSAFTLTSPDAVNQMKFVDGFLEVTAFTSGGHWYAQENPPWEWIQLLTKTESAGLFWVILSLFALPLGIYFSNKTRSSNHTALLLSWILIYLTVLMWKVESRFNHYLLPVIPFVFLLGANTVDLIIAAIQKERRKYYFGALALAILLLNFPVVRNAKLSREQKVQNSGVLQAGKWIEQNLPAEKTRIYTDKYTYVPMAYSCYKTWGMHDAEYAAYSPTHLMINEEVYGRYFPESNANHYNDGIAAFYERHDFYKSLLSGEEWSQLAQFGTIRIYGRKPSTPIPHQDFN